MKKTILFLSAFISVLTACKDDVNRNDYGPAATGDEIQFSANHADYEFNGGKTRTIYGPISEDKKTYPIYWVNNDEIGIFCPQAANSEHTPNHEFHYKVVVDNETSSTGTLAKINMGENGLQWGTADEHHFYAIYPASASEGGVSATQVKCSLPVRQDPVSIEFNEETGTYTAYPNMNYAYMYAHSKASRLKEGDKPITLDFKPLVTVLEITVNGPAGTVSGNSYQVSQVSIRSNENIAGEFLLTIDENFGDEDGKCTQVDNGTVSNLITIPTYQDGKPVTLKTGQKLVVKAFLLPYAAPEVAQTAITVNMVGQGSNTKLLETANIQSQKINITSLPALKGTDFYYWMSAMDKRTYFSQLSIPGTHNAYSYDADVVGTNTVMGPYQKLDIEQQFAAGARAFSFMVGFQNADKANDAVGFGSFPERSWTNWNDDYDLYTYDANSSRTELTKALNSYVQMLDSRITEYNDKYGKLGRKCQEFIVLNINFKQLRTSGDDNSGKYLEVKRWIKEIDRILDGYNPSSVNGIKLETNLNANTTIEDLMGKIVVFVNYQCPGLPDSEGKIDRYLLGEEYAGYTYNPLTDATNYVFMRQAYNTSGTDISSQLYAQNDRDIDYPYYMTPENASGITVWKQHLERLNNPNLSVPNWSDNGRVDKKISIVKDFIQQAINNNKPEAGDAGLRNWYINSLGGFCVVNDNQSYNPAQGQSGNTVTAANEINGPIYDYLIDPTNNSAPIGVVLMNFFGCDYIQNEGSPMDVYGKWLPQTIIENNFRFELKRKEGGTTDLNYDATFEEGGNVIE
ncbi:fimbrillin family protein [Phocaeicola coprophilus]|uniref:fimbrillin family protein n=1 Tax=Phocaeicola coprophilus TaxID=387090 RepID=UPI0026DFEF13|nr:fimbrillin family protein [Phocaeicola coprophilus]